MDAAEAVNEPLEGLARAYGVGWGILAAIDMMAADDEYRAFELAEMLASVATYEEVEVVTTIWKRISLEASSSVSGFIPGYGQSVTFTNEWEGTPKRWNAVIKNQSGSTVRSWSGSGSPPRQIVWNGRNNQGVIVSPGKYTYYLILTYEGSVHTSDPVSVKVFDASAANANGGAVGQGEDDSQFEYDLDDFYVEETIVETEKLVTSVDTYRGIYTFSYRLVESESVTDAEDGVATEVTVIKRYVLERMEYEPCWDRLKEALMLRFGSPELEPPDSDVIFSEEFGLMIQRGVVRWSGLDESTTLAEYRGSGVSEILASVDGYVWPVEGYYGISDPFGKYRYYPQIGVDGVHTGIDIPAPTGTNCLAVIDGYIGLIGETVRSGKYLRLDGIDGNRYYYYHLHHWANSHVGKYVYAGDVIAAVGSTGTAVTGSHLHFEAHVNGVPVDPVELLGFE
jgi:hypothetical protein